MHTGEDTFGSEEFVFKILSKREWTELAIFMGCNP